LLRVGDVNLGVSIVQKRERTKCGRFSIEGREKRRL
jgi:hypothetical protein